MKYRTVALLLLLMFSITLSAQRRVKISGRVIDADNAPIELVNIRVEKSLIGTMSDLKGNFELILPSSDSVSIVFSSLGYKRVVKNIYGLEQDIRLEVRMYSSTQDLSEVVVTEHRRQTSTVQNINTQDIRLMPSAAGGGIEAMLSTFAGVNSSNELSSQYSVRGGNFDENIVYVNGIEVYRPLLVRSGQQEGLSFINPDMVSEVGFSSGGYAVEYGDKMSSVLDITYKKPKAFEGAVSIGFLGATASVGHSTKNFTQLHSFRYKTNSTLLSSLDTKGEYDPSFFDYQTYLTYQITPKWELSLLGNIAVNNYKFIPRERSTSFGTMSAAKQFKVYFDGREQDLFESYFGALTLSHKLSKTTDLSLMASAFTTDEEVTYDIGGQYWLNELDPGVEAGGSKDKNETLGVGTYHEHARNRLKASVMAVALKGTTRLMQQEIKYGINYQREVINDKVREWEMRDSAGYSLPHTGNGIEMISNLYSNQQIASNRLSLFAQDTYKLRGTAGLFTFVAGVRASYWDFNKEWIVSPRASVALIPSFNNHFTFRFATGLYYQSPFYKEFRDTLRDENNNTIVALNRNIKSQRSTHFVLGGDYTFRAVDRPFKLTAELYYKKLDNLVPYEVDNVRVWYYGRNMANGYTAGVDFKLFGEFVPGTDSWLSFSLMSSKENINGVTVPRPTEQRYSIALFFQDYWPTNPNYKLHLKAIWSDGLPVAPPRLGRANGYFRTPAYRRVDIGVSRLLLSNESRLMRSPMLRHLKSVWIGIDVFNLLDISNVNSYYWVTDVYNQQYAVPNFLTMRQINLRISVDF